MIKSKFKIGLKIWSTNDSYAPLLIDLFEKGCFDYVELYVVPGSYEQYSKMCGAFDFPYIVHCPNDVLNLADKEAYAYNQKLFAEVCEFADLLQACKIIIHPGLNGPLEENIRQLKDLNDNRLVIENMPLVGLQEQVCLGASPEEIKEVLTSVPCLSFCLDIGHAIAFAAFNKTPYMDVIRYFIKLSPSMYHLSDGHVADKYDKHLNFGEGDYDLSAILNEIPDGSMLSIETPKESHSDLNEHIKDVEFIKEIESVQL